MTIRSDSFSFLCLSLCASLALTACPGEGNPTTSIDPSATGDDTDSTTSTSTSSSSTSSSTTDEPTTTNGVDPCDACSPDAYCKQGVCECKEGYSGDGETCDDIDECAKGTDNCSPDADCSNEAGGFSCACKAGYEGDGFDCKDVDECADNLNNCSPVADCTNTDGGFTCKCKDGFEGDGVSCMGSKMFGDTCMIPEECASGICLTDAPGQCTVACTQMVAHDCRDQGYSGLCIATTDPNLFVCKGDFNGGPDKDDTVMVPGDASMRQFQNKTDADLFLINHGVKDITFSATPDLDDDLELQVFGANGDELGVVNNGGIGVAEAADVTVGGVAGVIFVVVRNIGNSNGSYKISVANL